MNITQLLIIWLVTSVSFFIISKLPTGVEIDGVNKALVSAAVFGIVNALLGPVINLLALPFNFITLGLFKVVVNGIIFGLAAALVHGFRLRWGIWSALIGAFALGIINQLIFQVLGFNK